MFVLADGYTPGDPVVAVDPDTPGDLIRVGNGGANGGTLRAFHTAGLEHSYAIDNSLFGQRGRTTIGARLHWETFADEKKAGTAPDSRDGDFTQRHRYRTLAGASYLSHAIRVGDLSFTPGLRMEVFEQSQTDRLDGDVERAKTTSVMLPGLGANYAMGEFNLFGGVHRGYTPPTSSTLKTVNFGDDVADGGLDLEAEKSWNMEVGVRGRVATCGL